MGQPDLLGSGGFDGRDETVPVGVVREHETFVERLTPAGSTDGHPTGRESGGKRAEPAHPGRAKSGRWCNDKRLRPLGIRFFRFGVTGRFRDILSRRQSNPIIAINSIQGLDGSVAINRANGGVDAGQKPLGFAERVGHQDACQPMGLIGFPPMVDLVENF